MTRREMAIAFAPIIEALVLRFGGEQSTAKHCCAEWWRAIERGDFGEEPTAAA